MRKRRKWGPAALSLAAEAVMIVFSVLLALSLAEWRDVRRERRAVATALDLVAEELRTNKEMLDQRVAYYRTMRDTLDWMIAQSGPDVEPDAIPGWQGIMPALLSDGSYQAAHTTQAFANMDLRTASALARVYAFQEMYQGFMDKMIDWVIDEQEETVGEFRGAFGEMSSISAELSGFYGQGLEVIERTREAE